MGIVTDKLIELVRDQVKEHRVVVWFDPEQAYTNAVTELANIGDARVFRYEPERGFISLRRSLEDLWGAQTDVPPCLVVYVPMARLEAHHALIEFAVAGSVMEPGQQPPECNTRLAAVARTALAPLLSPTALEQIIVDVEAKRLSLAELDAEAEKNAQVRGVLTVIFGTGNLQEIALRFLADPSIDKEVEKRNAIHALRELFASAFELTLPKGDDLAALRAVLARHLLVTEFCESLHGPLPERLTTLPRAKSKAALGTVVELVREWRLRRDLGAGYVQSAQRVEGELGLGDISWTLDALQASETFYRGELALQSLVEAEFLKKVDDKLLQWVQSRANGFWSTQKPESKQRWLIIGEAGQVLSRINRVDRELKGHELPANSLYLRYTSGDAPWCDLDGSYRHLDRDYHRFDVEETTHDGLVRLVTHAEQSYREWVDALANLFVHGYQADGFDLDGVVHQADVFRSFVAPAVGEGSVAYFLVDALRYEMARELITQFPEDFESDLTPALATTPTITVVGMAALMPGTERGVGLVPSGGKLAVDLGGNTLKNRQDRLKYLEKQVERKVVTIELSELAPLNKKKLRKSLSEADLIVVTATDEIDGLWETSPSLARQMQEDVFNQLRRGLRSLFGIGVRKVIITADHGYLIGTQLIPSETVEPPGGDTVELKRRVWVGKGGSAIPGFLRTPTTALGLGGELELVTPYGLACFKVPGGSMVYFHGGLSLQEMVIPVLAVSPSKPQAKVGLPAFTWKLNPGVKKITTRFFTVTIEGEARELFSTAPRVRVELRSGDQIVSVPVAASYGFREDTRDVALQYNEKAPQQIVPNSITLQVTEIPNASEVTLHLLDSETGASLAQLPHVSIDIAF